MNKKLLLTILIILAGIGAYSLSQYPPVIAFISDVWNKMQSAEFKSSIASAHKKKGLKFPKKIFKNKPQKITSKSPSKWIVDINRNEDSDSGNLDDVLFSAKKGDLILIRPGTYPVRNLNIKFPLVIKGLGSTAKATVIRPYSQSSIDLNGNRSGPVEFSNLLLSGKKANGFYGALITIENTTINFENIDFLARGKEIALFFKNNSSCKLRSSFFSTGERGTAIRLSGNAKINITNTQFKNNKVAIYGDINSFQGKVNIKNSEITTSRGAGISIYAGISHLENVKINRNLVGLSFRNKAQATILRSHIHDNELNGIDIDDNSSILLKNSQIENNGKYGIQVNNNAKNIIIEDSQITHNMTGLYTNDNSNVSLVNTVISTNNLHGIILHKKSSLIGSGLKIVKNAQRGISISNSNAKIKYTLIEHNRFGIHTSNNSTIEIKDVSIKNNTKNIKNVFNNSSIKSF